MEGSRIDKNDINFLLRESKKNVEKNDMEKSSDKKEKLSEEKSSKEKSSEEKIPNDNDRKTDETKVEKKIQESVKVVKKIHVPKVEKKIPKLVKPTLPDVTVNEIIDQESDCSKKIPKLKKSSFQAPVLKEKQNKKISSSFKL